LIENSPQRNEKSSWNSESEVGTDTRLEVVEPEPVGFGAPNSRKSS